MALPRRLNSKTSERSALKRKRLGQADPLVGNTFAEWVQHLHRVGPSWLCVGAPAEASRSKVVQLSFARAVFFPRAHTQTHTHRKSGKNPTEPSKVAFQLAHLLCCRVTEVCTLTAEDFCWPSRSVSVLELKKATKKQKRAKKA